MNYKIILGLFDENGNFDKTKNLKKSEDDGDAEWGISINGEFPSEENFIGTIDKEGAKEIKKYLIKYNKAFDEVLSAISKNCYNDKYDTAYEKFYKLTWHPD